MDSGAVVDLLETDEWRALVGHHGRLADVHLRQLFADDPDRGTDMVARAGDLVLDYAKHRVDADALAALLSVAGRAGVAGRRDAMFAGERINTTEGRSVLHVALRMPREAQLIVDGRDVVADVHGVLDAMGSVAERIRSGAWTGHTGQRIRAVVNIGIGGSDLGPAMAHEALRDFAHPAIDCRFVSNVDPVDLFAKTHDLDPASTLFVVSSKTFTTQETLTNARAARSWWLE
jgi:glucose-6-phosphate isomerase